MHVYGLQIHPHAEGRKAKVRPRQGSSGSACDLEEAVLSRDTLRQRTAVPYHPLVKGLTNTNHLEAVELTLNPSHTEDVCLIYTAYLDVFGQLG